MFTPPVEAKRRSRLSGSKMPQSGAQLNVFDFLFNRGGMFIPCNVYPVKSDRYFTGACPACLRAPREIHISDSAAYFTGVAKNDRIGRARLDLVNQGHAIPPGREVHRESGGFTACNACPACPVGRNYRTGVEYLGLFHSGSTISKKVYPKSSTSTVLVELFYVYSVE